MTKAEKAHHELMDEHFSESAKCHKALRDHLEASDPVASGHHAGIMTACEKMAASHRSMGAMPVDKVEGGDAELVKGLRELLKTVVPLPGGFRMVPASDRPTLVPRTGQPDPVEKTQIDKKLEDIVYDPNQATG
jgi:hypothetical protein